MLKSLLIPAFCMLLSAVYAQQKQGDYFRRELSFTNDNDAYLFQKKDANYTNGLFLKLTTAAQKNGNKRVRSYEIGQMIYTPLIRKTAAPEDIDRPYCGYLFFKYNESQFFANESVLQYSVSLGVVGAASFGEDMQNSYHKLFRYAPFTGWQYQVQNALGIDLGFNYARTVIEDSSWLKWVPDIQVNLGSTFTNAKLGAYLCVGSFEKNSNSALWNARVQNKATQTNRKYELFAYWHPQIIFQAYNATVEGGLFSKGNGAVLRETEPWMFQQTWGLCYAQGRWTTKIELIYQSREAVTQKNPQRYGSLQLGYRLH